MGLGLIGSSGTRSYVTEVAERESIAPSAVITWPNPNPFRFSVNWVDHDYGHTIMSVRYSDCTTFDGNKLLLLRGYHKAGDFTELDPHFFPDPHPVIARFIPTVEGLRMARAAARSLK